MSSTLLYAIGARMEPVRARNNIENSEELTAIIKERETLLDQVENQMAEKLLKFLRERIKPFRTHNHKIWVSYSMGLVAIRINDDYVSDYTAHNTLVDLLWDIENMLEDCPLVSYLEEKVLNP